MARTLTGSMITEITASSLIPILLAKFEFDSGTTRVWSGVGDFTFNSEIYIGVGDLGSISEITETQVIRASGMTFSLSGIPSALISIALTEEYQGRSCSLWLGMLDKTTRALISTPFKILTARMDVMTIDEEGETATISIAAENILIDLERPNERRYTPEDQKEEFPGDKGFDFVPSIQDAEIFWGSQEVGTKLSTQDWGRRR